MAPDSVISPEMWPGTDRRQRSIPDKTGRAAVFPDDFVGLHTYCPTLAVPHMFKDRSLHCPFGK